jgi:hypothetical protein
MWDKKNLDRIVFSPACMDDMSNELHDALNNYEIEAPFAPFEQVDANPTGQQNMWR